MRSYSLLTAFCVVVLAGLYDYLPDPFASPFRTANRNLAEAQEEVRKHPKSLKAQKNLAQAQRSWQSVADTQAWLAREEREHAREVADNKRPSRRLRKALFGR